MSFNGSSLAQGASSPSPSKKGGSRSRALGSNPGAVEEEGSGMMIGLAVGGAVLLILVVYAMIPLCMPSCKFSGLYFWCPKPNVEVKCTGVKSYAVSDADANAKYDVELPEPPTAGSIAETLKGGSGKKDFATLKEFMAWSAPCTKGDGDALTQFNALKLVKTTKEAGDVKWVPENDTKEKVLCAIPSKNAGTQIAVQMTCTVTQKFT